jgi:hypothetical protein
MLGNGNPKYGDKGSNFKYELSVLQLLEVISIAIPAAACCPTAATEATLQQVLAAIQSGQEYEQNLVVDQGGVGCPANCPTYLQIRIWNSVTHTFDPPIYYDASGAVVVPVGPLALVNPQFVLENILAQVTASNVLLTDIELNTSPVNTVPGFTIDTTSIIATAVPTGVKAFSLLFRGTGGELNGAVVPDGYRVDFGNGKDPVVTAMTYLRPTAGTGQEVLISTLT